MSCLRREYGDTRDGSCRRTGPEAAMEGGGTEREDAAILADHEVAAQTGRDHAGHRPIQLRVTHRSVEGRVEGEDSTVGRDKPVTDTVRVGHEALNRCIQPCGTHRS